MTQKPSPLRRILDEQGRRRDWLAKRVGVDPAEITRIVNHGQIPREDRRVAIAEALGIDPSELWPDLHAETAA